MLVIWHRCIYSTTKPAIPGSIRCCRRMYPYHTLSNFQIDPHRTVSSGKVDIGAFRTYPEKYIVDAEPGEYQSIPLNKIEDFGVHANQYYSLEISHFKSSLDTKVLDLLWNKYWVATLSQSPLIIVSSSFSPFNTQQPGSYMSSLFRG